jgi:hypothetical protein
LEKLLTQPLYFRRNGLVHFRVFFRFWDGFLSVFAFSDAETRGKLHDFTIEHIKHARQCVSGA